MRKMILIICLLVCAVLLTACADINGETETLRQEENTTENTVTMEQTG